MQAIFQANVKADSAAMARTINLINILVHPLSCLLKTIMAATRTAIKFLNVREISRLQPFSVAGCHVPS